jgi:hypothetical protein
LKIDRQTPSPTEAQIVAQPMKAMRHNDDAIKPDAGVKKANLKSLISLLFLWKIRIAKSINISYLFRNFN